MATPKTTSIKPKKPEIDEELVESTLELVGEMNPKERAEFLQDALTEWCPNWGDETNEEGECEKPDCNLDEDEEDEEDETDGEEDGEEDESGNDAGEPA